MRGADFACALSNGQVNKTQHWRVDFGNIAAVSRVKVYGRIDSCCFFRVSNFDIRIGDRDEAGSNPVFAQNREALAPPDIAREFISGEFALGRYLYIESNLLGQPMGICEVEVYGHLYS